MPTPSKKAALRKRLLIITATTFILIGVAYSIWWVIFASHYESTDNAYVHGNMVQVSSQIAGTVVGIKADDTQLVSKGDIVIRLDAADTKLALEQAQAALAQTVRRTSTLFVQNSALQADIALRQANVERAQVDLAKAQNDLKRRQTLAKSGGISGEEILHAQTSVKAAKSSLAQTQAALSAAKANLAANKALTSNANVANHPDVQQAADQLRKAWLMNTRTQLPAPVDGMVAQRSVQVGQHVTPGMPLMTLIPLHEVWVEANFKENQVARMMPGQKATLSADLYGQKVTYKGKIQGIAAGTGSAFALLPAQNATGNWIKVVQRIPVRITLDPNDLRSHPLRVGLSMTVEVDVSAIGQASSKATPNTVLETSVFDEGKAGVDALINKIIHDNLQP